MRPDFSPQIEEDSPLRRFCTLRAGGPARWLFRARSLDQLADSVTWAHDANADMAVIGWGSNLLPSDLGHPGLVIVNQATEISFGPDGLVTASTGIGFQEVFLKAAQRGLSGLEFAVGIPGTLGGALVSNAGAYRSGISALVEEVEVIHEGQRRWSDPSLLEFGYRDSVLRRPNPPRLTVIQVKMRLRPGKAKDIYDLARDNQRQRISKQPPPASAGSFFKNVVDHALAQQIPGLTEGMRQAGVIPAGFLIERSGLKGLRKGGARFHPKHANFMTNVGGAAASDIRSLAEEVKARVYADFGVVLEEEALYFGDWSHWPDSYTRQP